MNTLEFWTEILDPIVKQLDSSNPFWALGALNVAQRECFVNVRSRHEILWDWGMDLCCIPALGSPFDNESGERVPPVKECPLSPALNSFG